MSVQKTGFDLFALKKVNPVCPFYPLLPSSHPIEYGRDNVSYGNEQKSCRLCG
jgi:hypothetical protein